MDELCALATRLGLDYCAEVFHKSDVDGAELVHTTKASFVSLLTSAGARDRGMSTFMFMLIVYSLVALRRARCQNHESLGSSAAACQCCRDKSEPYRECLALHHDT